MLLVKINNGSVEQYPYSVGLLRRDNPNTSFPKQVSAADINPFNVYEVLEVTPAISSVQNLVKVWVPTLVGTQWTLAHRAVAKTDAEISEDTAVLAANVREQRNKLLAVTDWTSASDVTMSTAMTTYRQALRDVPSQSDFPGTVTWPTLP